MDSVSNDGDGEDDSCKQGSSRIELDMDLFEEEEKELPVKANKLLEGVDCTNEEHEFIDDDDDDESVGRRLDAPMQTSLSAVSYTPQRVEAFRHSPYQPLQPTRPSAPPAPPYSEPRRRQPSTQYRDQHEEKIQHQGQHHRTSLLTTASAPSFQSPTNSYPSSAVDLDEVDDFLELLGSQDDDEDSDDVDKRGLLNCVPTKYLSSRKSAMTITAPSSETLPQFRASNKMPRMSLESPQSITSSRSSSTMNSRRYSMISHRSSTSTSLLFGEVINLEDSRLRQSFQNNHGSAPTNSTRYMPVESPSTIGDVEEQWQGVEVGGGIRRENLHQTHAQRFFPSQHVWDDRTHHHPFKIPTTALLTSWNTVKTMGRATNYKLSKIKRKTKDVAQRFIHSYRPPLSPHARALEDLEYLQKAHREKVGQLTKHAEMEEHYDFVLLLKPQEVYRYWADLLDFRVEHLGDEFLAAMDPTIVNRHMNTTTALESSTTYSSSNSDNESLYSDDDGLEPLRQNIYTTPSTGMRRRARTPDTPDDSTDGSSPLPLSPLTRVMQMSPSVSTVFSPAATFQSASTIGGKPVQASLNLPTTAKRLGHRQSLFEKAIGVPPSPTANANNDVSDFELNKDSIPTATNNVIPETPMRRRWGNRAVHNKSSSVANLLSPPVRSLTRGASSVRKIKVHQVDKSGNCSNNDDIENSDPNLRVPTAEDFPNPIIPRGIAARTNGMLPFLSALKRGFVVRRHRAGRGAVYCKLFSNNGGDTIQYQLIDKADAMVAFKEQRVRYNRRLTHSSSPTAVRSLAQEWACIDGPECNSLIHKFNVPDHVAASKYREKMAKSMKKKIREVANKAANSGFVRAADVVAVHPASHADPRYPGLHRGELGTATLRKSESEYDASQTFSIVVHSTQRFKKSKDESSRRRNKDENRWYERKGKEINYKILDFEAATIGEYWLIFRGFLLLQRDVVVGRFASDRRAGIGGGANKKNEDYDNLLHRDEFLEPVTVGTLEKAFVRARKLDDTYITGGVAPRAVPPPSDYFLGFRSPGTQIWSRLRLAGLETTRVYSVDTRLVMIKIRCPEDRLTDVAEVLRVKMRLHDGRFAPFREDAAHLFRQLNDPHDVPSIYQGQKASLLYSKYRQSIIDFIIGSRIRDSGAELGPTTDVGKMIKARMPLHMHAKLESLVQPWIYYWRKENWQGKNLEDDDDVLKEYGVDDEESGLQSDAAQPYTNEKVDEEIPNFMIRFFVGAFHQPLDSIEEYFGEKVTFYFAWLQHCARHLLVLTLLGMIVTICQLSSNNVDHPIRPYFSIVVMIWTFMVLLNWRKRSNLLADKWGSINYKDKENPRPEFHGEYVIDEITGEWVVKYPHWKRWLKYTISVPITIFFTVFVLLLILAVHANRDLQMANYVKQLNDPGAEPYQFGLSFQNIGKKAELVEIHLTRELLSDSSFWMVMCALPALLGLCIPILNLILMRISVMLNDFENYRTESEYRTHLIIKVFGFRFVSQFGTLYYYATLAIGDEQSVQNGLIRMSTSLMIYTTVAHWWSIFLQVYFFMAIRNIRRFLYRRKLHSELKKIELEEESINTNLSDAEARQVRLINRRMLLDQAQDETWFELMNPAHDSFPEYVSAVLQFSFVACFSVVLPITPLFCLFNYLLSMRYDAYKLCRGRRRPLAQQTGGIGIWEHLLHIVAVISVLTNCWLVAFTTADFAWIQAKVGQLGLFAIVIAWEHVMLLIKYVMQSSMSPMPRIVRNKMKREQHTIDKERYDTMRTKDHGRRGKTEKKSATSGTPPLTGVQFRQREVSSHSPALETILSYESLISDTETLNA